MGFNPLNISFRSVFSKRILSLWIINSFIITSVFYLGNYSSATHHINAEEAPSSDIIEASIQNNETKGVILSPLFSEISVGQSYTLSITNYSESTQNVKILPSIFTIDSSNSKIVPLDQSSWPVNEEDLINEYIEISEPEISLENGSKRQVRIRYKKELDKYHLGVIAGFSSGGDQGVGVNKQLASVIIDPIFTENDLREIHTRIAITPRYKILGVGLGNKFDIESAINNNSGKIIKASGNIQIENSNQRIGNISLTQKLPKSIYPENGFQAKFEFEDKRPFYKRAGKFNSRQNIKIGDKTIEAESGTFVLPFEFIAIFGLISLIVILISLYLIKLSSKKKQQPKVISFQTKQKSL